MVSQKAHFAAEAQRKQNHPVCCSILGRLHDEHIFAADACVALPEYKELIHKANEAEARLFSPTGHPDYTRTKLAGRGHGHARAATVIITHCFDVVRRGKLRDKITFERKGFAWLAHIVATLTIVDREEVFFRRSSSQAEKNVDLAKSRRSNRAWSAKEPKLTLHAATDQQSGPSEYPDEAWARLCRHWRGVFQAQENGPQDQCHETILEYVRRALDDRQRTLGKDKCDNFLAAMC